MMPKGLQEGFLKVNNDETALLNMFNKDVERMKNFKDWDDELLQNIKAPALIVSGDKDVATVEHTLKVSRLIPNAELLILPGTHGECLGEAADDQPKSKQFEATVLLIKNFLDK